MLLYRKDCLILWLVIAFVGILFAGTDAYTQGQHGPCADDIARLCKDVKPGEGRLAKCIKEHEKELSSTFKASLEEAKMKLKDAQQACSDDIQKFCKDNKPGQGRIVKCLREHQKDLSPACQATMVEPKKSKKIAFLVQLLLL